MVYTTQVHVFWGFHVFVYLCHPHRLDTEFQTRDCCITCSQVRYLEATSHPLRAGNLQRAIKTLQYGDVSHIGQVDHIGQVVHIGQVIHMKFT
jgi:hypothetical protein